MHLIPPEPVRSIGEVERFFEAASRANATVVLYHVRREDLLPPDRVGAFELVHTVANRSHRLLVFKTPS